MSLPPTPFYTSNSLIPPTFWTQNRSPEARSAESSPMIKTEDGDNGEPSSAAIVHPASTLSPSPTPKSSRKRQPKIHEVLAATSSKKPTRASTPQPAPVDPHGLTDESDSDAPLFRNRHTPKKESAVAVAVESATSNNDASIEESTSQIPAATLTDSGAPVPDPTPPSSDADDIDDPIVSPHRKRRLPTTLPDDDDTDDAPWPTQLRRMVTPPAAGPEDVEMDQTQTIQGGRMRSFGLGLGLGDVDENEDEEEETSKWAGRLRRRIVVDTQSGVGGEVEGRNGLERELKRSAREQGRAGNRRRGARSDEREAQTATVAVGTRRSSRARGKQVVRGGDSSEEDEGEASVRPRRGKRVVRGGDSNEEDDGEASVRPKRGKRGVRESDSSEEDESEASVRPKRKRLMSRSQVGNDADADADADVEGESAASGKGHEESDMEIEQDAGELDKNVILNQRTRTRRVSRFKDALQRLEARKGNHSDPVYEVKEEEDEDIGDGDEVVDLDGDDDEFIIKDDEGGEDSTREGPTREEEIELLAELGLIGTGKMSDKFKVLVQYLVHLAYDEEFADTAKNSGYFTTALDGIQRQIDTYNSSLVSSTAWNKHFRKDLERFPTFNDKHIGAIDRCEACGISKRTATYEVQFGGEVYDRQTLRPKPITSSVSDSDHLDDYSSDPGDYDYASLPYQSSYAVGRFCHSRAKIYHRLHHLRRGLFERVQVEIEVRAPGLQVAREDGETAQASGLKIVDDVLLELEREGFVKELWREVKALLEEAEQFCNIPNFKWNKL